MDMKGKFVCVSDFTKQELLEVEDALSSKYSMSETVDGMMSSYIHGYYGVDHEGDIIFYGNYGSYGGDSSPTSKSEFLEMIGLDEPPEPKISGEVTLYKVLAKNGNTYYFFKESIGQVISWENIQLARDALCSVCVDRDGKILRSVYSIEEMLHTNFTIKEL